MLRVIIQNTEYSFTATEPKSVYQEEKTKQAPQMDCAASLFGRKCGLTQIYSVNRSNL